MTIEPGTRFNIDLDALLTVNLGRGKLTAIDGTQRRISDNGFGETTLMCKKKVAAKHLDECEIVGDDGDSECFYCIDLSLGDASIRFPLLAGELEVLIA